MDMLEWYHNRRLISHYEEEADTSMLVMLFMWSLAAILALTAILMAANTIPYWWVALIPSGVSFTSGMLSFINYLSAREMIEWIKWRM